MSEHKVTVEWERQTPDFDHGTYNRSHMLVFGHSTRVPATAAAANVPPTAACGPGVDPEQAFVASLSSCHMLWFLHLASRAGFAVDRYVDEASGALAKNAEGRMAMTRVTLRPAVAFAGRAPSAEEHARLHEGAHQKCFIANSVKTEIVVEPRIA
jgi:organic hydroperoxide reductase OsmC/OhrA